MHTFRTEKKLPYSAKELFLVVLDIEAYPQFLPWCRQVNILFKDDRQMVAELIIGFSGFLERYKSRITFASSYNYYSIKVEAVSGPFAFLKNNWQFWQEENNSKVEFDINFKFRSWIFDKMIGLFFARAANKMIEAFEHRAKLICSQRLVLN